MAQAGPFLRSTDGGFMFWCPGCDESHYIGVTRPLPNGAGWSFNGDVERPTFSPSIHVRTCEAVDPTFVREEGDPPAICHSFVTDGRIQFCGDSTHALSGQTVDLPAWPDHA